MVPLQGRGHRGEGNWEELLFASREESDEKEEGSEGEEEESEEEEEAMTVAMAAEATMV